MPNASDRNVVQLAPEIVTRGLAPGNILHIVAGITDSEINSIYDDNPKDPETSIYPHKSSDDAPYDVSEDRLRSAIHIPHSFTYGANGKRPVLLVPGTADPAGSTYYFSYDTNLVHALRSDNGDSVYVPTTSVYSGIDEIVQPQSDPNASAALEDVRGVGVTNTQIQLACPGKPAGLLYLHETMLVNPIAYALVVDALTQDGPGQLSRIDLDTVCGQLVPPGLDLDDLLGTEAVAAVLGPLDILSYGYLGDNVEPPLKSYART